MESQRATKTAKGRGKRTARLEARISPKIKELLERAAALEGTSLSDFVVKSLDEAARRAVRDHEIIRLTEQEQKAFADALVNSPKPNPALRKAFKKYRAWKES